MSTGNEAISKGERALPMARRVLVVCAANVCRSPSIEFMLQQQLTASTSGAPWAVESAGTSARPGQMMCPQSSTYLSGLPGGGEFVVRHRSRPLTKAAVEHAGLVLVASTAERAAVAAFSPTARRRTFTLREAAMMMRRVSGGAAADHGGGWPLATDESELLPTVVDLLHEQRGTLAISAGPAHLSSWRARAARRSDGGVSPMDIADVHQGHERRHKPVLKTIADDTKAVARGVGLLAVLPETSTSRPAAVRRLPLR